jgi:hypothetical protein
MTSHSPATIPGVREQIARDTVPRDLAARPELVPRPAVPVRPAIAAAAISTGAFVALSLTPYAGVSAVVVQGSAGVALLVNELFWLSAAAMGASFAMLLQAGGVRATGSDERSYGLQFAAGVMAGFILVALFPVGELMGFSGLSQPAAAMLGAFLASMALHLLPGRRTPPGNGGDNATEEP